MKNIKIYIVLLFVSLLLFSCNWFKKTLEKEPVARVNEKELFKDDLIKVLPDNLNKEDSILFARQYINNWATKQLLKQKAELNLNQSTQDRFNDLTEAYRLDLFTNAYLNILISKQLDTIIASSDLEEAYDKMNKNFVLKEDLLQLRYICLDKDYKNLNKVAEQLKKFTNEDKEDLDSLSIQFHSFRLNDSVWVKQTDVLKQLPIIKEGNTNQLLKKSNFLALEDSLSLYLVHVTNLLKRGDQAPLDYVKPTLEQIILNKRKLELIKQLEIDIRKDALQNNEFEIFN